MNRYHLKEKATQLAEQLESVTEELANTLTKLQQQCDHPHDAIIQSPLRIGTFFDQEELRLCTICGLQEERGACGWNHVINKTGEYGRGNPIKEVSRDDIWRERDRILAGTSVGVRSKEHLEKDSSLNYG